MQLIFSNFKIVKGLTKYLRISLRIRNKVILIIKHKREYLLTKNEKIFCFKTHKWENENQRKSDVVVLNHIIIMLSLFICIK